MAVLNFREDFRCYDIDSPFLELKVLLDGVGQNPLVSSPHQFFHSKGVEQGIEEGALAGGVLGANDRQGFGEGITETELAFARSNS